MPNGVRIDARRAFVRRVLPWLIAAAMLVFYILTLNHGVSLTNLGTVATISGWSWTPQFFTPLYYVVIAPFRLLPAPAVPMALNLFSTVCAALALGLLAHSVALLPHDRTEAQQVRERNDFFLLTLKSAWLPPLLAVLLCGLQLTFWRMATNGGSEMFDLLLFAFVIWSLIEYRLDGRVWRLFASAAVVGAGIVEGQAITAFFPLFIVAVIWVRGLAFFNVEFLVRLFLYGLAGFLALLLWQLSPVFFSKTSLTSWQALKYSLGLQFEVLRLYWGAITSPGSYFGDLLPVFISLMPLLVMSVRWKFGDNSKIGSSLSGLMFHLIHAVFLLVCIWIAFDPPFSPREKNLGLTLYYLIALGAGYYTGYFLLVFGRRRPRAKDAPPFLARLANKTIVIGVWVIAGLAVTGLVCKNAPLVRTSNGDTIRRFTSLATQNLPPKAIVISDDAERMYLTQADLVSRGRAKDYLLVDTAWLPYPEYHRYLHKQAPKTWPLLVKPDQTNILNAVGLMEFLAYLGRTNELYYLHPSFGYYFEVFYLEPHGLVYKLKLLPRDTLLPPLPDKNLVAENENFWKTAQADALASLPGELPSSAPKTPSFVDAQLSRLHVPDEPDLNAALVGDYCSLSLDFWGVQLQRMGDLTDAAARFRTALDFNTNNIAARINQQVNDELEAGRRLSADPTSAAFAQFGVFDNLSKILANDGPIDDPGFCFQYGYTLAQDNGLFRQAVAPLNRAYEMDPGYLPGRIWLARVYGMNHMPDRMLDILRAPLPRTDESSEADTRQLHMLLSAAYFQKNELAEGTRLLEDEVSQSPTNQALLSTVEQIFMNRAMYSNALHVAQLDLRLSPDDPSRLLTLGFILNQLKQYNEAIAPLNRALAIQTENAKAQFQLANAYFGAGDLDAARTNYEKLQQDRANSPELAVSLEQIAWRRHDTNEAIRNIEIYLANAPTNTPEARLLEDHLRQLKP
ncbi:MAG TPA: tetratricopeptide repeat protein [Verrucomicrobiae bacterium]|nr:tetratricopeptide repeat protein [Verrucomicrobiae bacterium]